MVSRDNQILIAGGGPVGLTAAVELRRRGFHPRVIDPDTTPSPESRALAINARTLELLEPSGATEILLTAGHRIHRFLMTSESTVLAEVPITQVKHRFNFLLSLPQSQTEQILSEILAHQGGVLERSLSLTNFCFDDAAKVRANLSDGTETSLDILIGADGAHSLVRKRLGFDFVGESEPQIFSLADVALDNWKFPWDAVVISLKSDHIVGFIPMAEGFGRFITSRPDILNLLPPEAKVNRVSWQTEFRINYRQVRQYQRGNVFLAGDAAHIHSPLGGRGMNLGIEDACWLAWLIDQGRTSEYTSLRHSVAAKVLQATRQPTSLLSNQSPLARLIRNSIVPKLLSISFFQKRFFTQQMGLGSPNPPWLG